MKFPFHTVSTNHDMHEFATAEDFRRIFEDALDELYRLAFLLTVDDAMAERCFVHGVENAVKGNTVFKNWAHSWAKRTIIVGAIRLLRPRPRGTGVRKSTPTMVGAQEWCRDPTVKSVSALPEFDRFVFIITVLEHYPERDCALLMECSPSEVRNARLRAMQKISESQSANHAGIEATEEMGARLLT